MEPIYGEPVVAFPTRRRGRSPAQLIVLSFAAAITAGTVMLRLPVAHAHGAGVGWLDALFTATSAVCVTGLVVVDTGRDFSPVGQAIIAILMAVLLGIISLFTWVTVRRIRTERPP